MTETLIATGTTQVPGEAGRSIPVAPESAVVHAKAMQILEAAGVTRIEYDAYAAAVEAAAAELGLTVRAVDEAAPPRPQGERFEWGEAAVDEDSLALHVEAERRLAAAGKPAGVYSADDYERTVTAVRRERGLR
jgi:hypothetical protein